MQGKTAFTELNWVGARLNLAFGRATEVSLNPWVRAIRLLTASFWLGVLVLTALAVPFLAVLRSTLGSGARMLAIGGLLLLYGVSANSLLVGTARPPDHGPAALPAVAVPSPTPSEPVRMEASPTATLTLPTTVVTAAPLSVSTSAPRLTAAPAASLTYAPLTTGQQGKVRANSDQVVAGVSQAAYDALEKALVANDQIGANQLLFAGQIVLVDNGTRILCLQRTGFLGIGPAQVRILEGPYFGLALWMAPDFTAR